MCFNGLSLSPGRSIAALRQHSNDKVVVSSKAVVMTNTEPTASDQRLHSNGE